MSKFTRAAIFIAASMPLAFVALPASAGSTEITLTQADLEAIMENPSTYTVEAGDSAGTVKFSTYLTTNIGSIGFSDYAVDYSFYLAACESLPTSFFISQADAGLPADCIQLYQGSTLDSMGTFLRNGDYFNRVWLLEPLLQMGEEGATLGPEDARLYKGDGNVYNSANDYPVLRQMLVVTDTTDNSYTFLSSDYVDFSGTATENPNSPASNFEATTPSNENNQQQNDSNPESANDLSADVVRATPYAGPVVHPLGSSAASGGKATLSGSNLRGVTKVSINGIEAGVTVNTDGEIEITIPAGLAAGTYDLVITSDSGKLTIQDGITISGSAALGNASGSTKRMVDNTAKVWVFDVAGAGKVQIFVNGKEIAWVRTDDPNDAKLKEGYLVRTVELVDGKNVIEIYVDGERVRRTAYTK